MTAQYVLHVSVLRQGTWDPVPPSCLSVSFTEDFQPMIQNVEPSQQLRLRSGAGWSCERWAL